VPVDGKVNFGSEIDALSSNFTIRSHKETAIDDIMHGSYIMSRGSFKKSASLFKGEEPGYRMPPKTP